MSELPDIPQREMTLAYIEFEREKWLPIHKRLERSNRGDAELLLQDKFYMDKIDRLLDELLELDRENL